MSSNFFPDSTCPECNVFTFGGSRIRHAKGCQLARQAAEASRVRNEARLAARSPQYVAELETDPVILAEIQHDFDHHDD